MNRGKFIVKAVINGEVEAKRFNTRGEAEIYFYGKIAVVRKANPNKKWSMVADMRTSLGQNLLNFTHFDNGEEHYQELEPELLLVL